MANVEVMLDALRQSPANHQWVVVLKEKSKERYLPIWIGLAQAEEIKRELLGTSQDELDSQLMLLSDNLADVKLESITVDCFENNIFHARLSLTSEHKRFEVEAPIARALAMAIRVDAPIIIDEAVLEAAGVTT